MSILKREDGAKGSREASLALRAFRVGVAQEQRASLAVGVPYPIVDDSGQIVWIHPDGSRQATFEGKGSVT